MKIGVGDEVSLDGGGGGGGDLEERGFITGELGELLNFLDEGGGGGGGARLGAGEPGLGGIVFGGFFFNDSFAT